MGLVSQASLHALQRTCELVRIPLQILICLGLGRAHQQRMAEFGEMLREIEATQYAVRPHRLQHGRDPVTRRLAEEVIAGQTVEIESMQRRLAILRKSAANLAAEYPSLSGTRGPQ